jgi:hypothetical protein
MTAKPIRPLGQNNPRLRPVGDRDKHRSFAVIADAEVTLVLHLDQPGGVKRSRHIG